MCRRSILICGAVAIRALIAFASPVEGDVDFGSDAVERQTSTNESQVLTMACNANPQDNFAVCVEQLTAYINSSAAAWCQHQQEVLDDCLVPNHYDQRNCTDQLYNYDDCANQTLAMYMTCLGEFSMPVDLYQCANVDLFEGYSPPATTSIATSTLPTSSLLTFNTLTGPIPPSSTLSGAAATSSLSSSASTPASTSGLSSAASTPASTSSLSSAASTPASTSSLSSSASTPASTSGLSSSASIPASTSSLSSSASTPASTSTLTLTEVFTVTACPPDISSCPASSTYLSTVTTTSVLSAGGGTSSKPTIFSSVPTTRSSATPPSMPAMATTTVTRGMKEANVCGLKKRTRILKRDEA